MVKIIHTVVNKEDGTEKDCYSLPEAVDELCSLVDNGISTYMYRTHIQNGRVH